MLRGPEVPLCRITHDAQGAGRLFRQWEQGVKVKSGLLGVIVLVETAPFEGQWLCGVRRIRCGDILRRFANKLGITRS